MTPQAESALNHAPHNIQLLRGWCKWGGRRTVDNIIRGRLSSPINMTLVNRKRVAAAYGGIFTCTVIGLGSESSDWQSYS